LEGAMKRIFLLFIMTLFTSTALAIEAGRYRLSLSGGLGISGGEAEAISGSELGSLLGDPTLFKDGKIEESTAYNFGFGIDYFIIDRLSLVSGLYYASKPIKLVYPKNTSAVDLEFIFDTTYLVIPLGVRYYISWLFFGGGVYYGLIVDDAAEMKAGSYSEDVELDMNNDFGFFLDLGIDISITETRSIVIFARFERGLTYIYDEVDIITDVKTAAITFNLGFCFYL
jgi:hypothetical protein